MLDHRESKGIPKKKIYFCFTDYAKAFDCMDHSKLWKILKEMGIPDHITCLLRNLYAGQEATVRTGHGMMDWFKIGKGVCQGCSFRAVLSPHLLHTAISPFFLCQCCFFFKLDKKFLDVRGHPSMLLCSYLETGTGWTLQQGTCLLQDSHQ